MDSEARPDRMGTGEPRLGKKRRLARPPEPEKPFEATGEHWRKGLRCHLERQRRAFAVGQVRRVREVDSEADHDPVAAALEQNAGEFPPKKEQVVGPLQHQRLPRNRKVDRFDEREPRDERQGLRLWVARPKLDKRAPVEIAGRRNPLTPLPPPARLLFERDKPVAFASDGVGNEVGIGRAGSLDDADSAQKSVPAARSVNALRGSMSK